MARQKQPQQPWNKRRAHTPLAPQYQLSCKGLLLDIAEVSEILGLCSFLKAPKHVFITDERVSSHDDGVTFYRGLQPKAKGDSIFLSGQADYTSPIHETVHASLGLAEPGTELVTRVILRKNQVLQQFPLLKQTFSKKVVYKEVFESAEYPKAHAPEFQGRVRHFVLQER
jgi:hypothetical protein